MFGSNQQGMRQQEKPESEKMKFSLFPQAELKCKFSNPAFLYCSTHSCKQHALMCRYQNCKCLIDHSKCTDTILLKNFQNRLSDKIISNVDTTEAINLIQKSIDQLVDEASKMKDSIDERLKTFGLNKAQLMIGEAIKSLYQAELEEINPLSESQKSERRLSGNRFSRFNNAFKKSEQDWFADSIMDLKLIMAKSQKQILLQFEQISSLLVSLHAKYDKTANKFSRNFAESQVISNVEKNETKSIETFLKQTMQIDKIKKIFKYDVNKDKDFQLVLSRLQNVIEGKSNLMFLISNASKKKIGFFTPCKFSLSNQTFQTDEYQSSFLFCLDLNKSQKLLNPSCALRYTEDSITVGEQFVQIGQSGQRNGITIQMYQGLPTVSLVFKELHDANNNNNRGLFGGGGQSNNSTNNLVKQLGVDSDIVILQVYEIAVSKYLKKPNPKVPSPLNNLLPITSNNCIANTSIKFESPVSLFGNLKA